MTDEEELQKAYERGVQDGMKREHAMWQLAKIGQEIEAQPVAWIWEVDNGAGYSSKGIGFEKTSIPFAKHTPLYAVPPQYEKTDMQIGLTYEEANPPVAWVSNLPDNKIAIKIAGKPTEGNWEPLYTAPPKREWVGLTIEEINEVFGGEIYDENSGLLTFTRAIEVKLKDKNTC